MGPISAFLWLVNGVLGRRAGSPRYFWKFPDLGNV